MSLQLSFLSKFHPSAPLTHQTEKYCNGSAFPFKNRVSEKLHASTSPPNSCRNHSNGSRKGRATSSCVRPRRAAAAMVRVRGLRGYSVFFSSGLYRSRSRSRIPRRGPRQPKLHTALPTLFGPQVPGESSQAAASTPFPQCPAPGPAPPRLGDRRARSRPEPAALVAAGVLVQPHHRRGGPAVRRVRKLPSGTHRL